MRLALTATTVAGLVLTLAACGGGSDPKADASSSAPKVDYRSASAIAGALDAGGFSCSGYSASQTIGVREEGTCTHGENSIDVMTFNDSKQQKSTSDAFAALWGGVVVKGDAWQVITTDGAEAAQVAAILGGKVQ